MITENFNILNNYVPEKSLPILQKWFNQRPFLLKVVKKRATKYGDFRASLKGETPIITVNSNLNRYAFLITLTHEFAHLLVWHTHKHKVKAHGIEWKKEFQKLMAVLLQNEIFPETLTVVLKQHLKNPPASSARDINLVSELRRYDAPSNKVMLSEIPFGTKFSLNNKRIFVKGEKRRTRFHCTELKTKKQYLINGVADVLIINE